MFDCCLTKDHSATLLFGLLTRRIKDYMYITPEESSYNGKIDQNGRYPSLQPTFRGWRLNYNSTFKIFHNTRDTLQYTLLEEIKGHLQKWIFTTVGCMKVCCMESANGKKGWNRNDEILLIS